MIGYNPLKKLESLLSLSIPLEGVPFTEVSMEESRKNITDNLCTILEVSEHTSEGIRGNGSTGFMITTDGFIVTAYHTVEDWIPKWGIVTEKDIPEGHTRLEHWLNGWKQKYCAVFPNGKIYPLDPTFYGCDPNHDIALIKAVIPIEKPLPVRFRIVTAIYPGQGLEYAGLSCGQRYNQMGKVLEAERRFEHEGDTKFNTFLTDAYAKEGFSGGVIIDELNSGFLGLATYRDKNPNGGRHVIGAAKAVQVRDLVRLTQARKSYEILKE